MLPLYQGDLLAAIDDVVTVQGADRNEMQVGQIQSRRKRTVVVTDFVETIFAEVDQVHLVDGNDDVPNPQQRNNEAVSSGLRQHAVAGIDQDHGQVGRACPGRHVPRVLLVPRRVGDDELSLGRAEVTIGDIDRDALLTFRFEPIGQQRRIELSARWFPPSSNRLPAA